MRAVPPAVRPLVGVVGVLGGWAVLARVLSRGLPPGIILLGVVLGSLTALTAMGLVLVYRAARVINFAQVAIGSAAATLTLELANIRHWSYWAAAGAGLAFAALLGAAVDLLVIRRFFSVPRLILTLATVGLAQVFAGIELALPGLFDDSRSILGGSMEVPIDFTREVEPILFSGGHFMIMLAVPVGDGRARVPAQGHGGRPGDPGRVGEHRTGPPVRRPGAAPVDRRVGAGRPALHAVGRSWPCRSPGRCAARPASRRCSCRRWPPPCWPG